MQDTVQTITRKSAFDKRVHEIDFARGFLIILVLLDHFLNRILLDFKPLGGGFTALSDFVSAFYWDTPLRYIVQPLALIAFCFISGISTGFSKNNWKRSLILVIATIILGLFSPVLGAFLGFAPIYFNVIGVLATCSLVYCFVQKRSWKVSLALFLFFLLVTLYVIIPIMSDVYVYPWSPYVINDSSYWRSVFIPILSKPAPTQSDYMPLFPYIVFFFLGVLVSMFYYKDKTSICPELKRDWERPICFIGRHSLWFYIFHQILFMPIFALISLLAKG